MSGVAVEEQVSPTGSTTSTFSSSLPADEALNGRLGDFSNRQCSLLKNPPLRKAKRVKFYRNGDKFYKGVTMAVTPERYRSFDSLVSDLTRALVENVNIPSGVRTLFTMDGRKVCCLDDLEDGKCYVCLGQGESFKRVDYASSENIPPKNRHQRSLSGVHSTENIQHSSIKITPDYVRPRLITVIKSGARPRKVLRLLINKRNAPSFDHALSSITEVAKLDSGAVRKVFTLDGIPVTCLQDFFSDTDVFFVYGNERHSKDDFELDLEECKAIQAQSKYSTARRSGNSSTFPRSNISVGLDDHTMKSAVPRPKMPGKTKVPKNVQNQPQDFAYPVQIKTKYQVGELIGEGNFAVVRHCVDRSSGKEFAMKIIDKTKCKGREHMIDSEVAILRKIRHPNIIRLFGEHDFQSELYLVMELVKGGDLFDAIAAATKFSEKEASLMIRNLASALFYLHSLQIVHRDIKPENLLVEFDCDGNRVLKLGDFGLAQKVTETLYTICGTPTYVAPEILAETGYGLKIDVWAAGVILYVLLCGFPPFGSESGNQEELFDLILCGQYSFLSPYWDNISSLAKDLISHMLQVQPELRFSAEDVLDHLWLAEAGGTEQLKVHCSDLQFVSRDSSLKPSNGALSAVSR